MSPKYKFLLIPSFTDLPHGHDKSIIILLSMDPFLSAVFKGEIVRKELKGFFLVF